MEEKSVSFTGITQATSDLDCRDGDLSISHNIINQDGAMRPIVAPDVAFSLNVGEQLIYVHKGDGFKNYFITDSSNLLYFTDDNKTERQDVIPVRDRTIRQMVGIGNSVAVLFEDGIEYLLYKDNGYKTLGSKPPELQISFGLVGGPSKEVVGMQVDCSSNDIEGRGGSYLLGATAKSVTDVLVARINEVLAKFRYNNLFSQPFLICYAYKLLGQTDYMVSPPVLMQPVSHGCYPFIQATKLNLSSNILKGFTCDMMFAACRPDYHIRKEVLERLHDWKEIITSVDIYVSPEIPIFKESGLFGGIYSAKGSSSNFLTCTYGKSSITLYESEEQYNRLNPVYAELGTIGNHIGSSMEYALNTPVYTTEEVNEKIYGSSNFYLYKSYKIEELKTVQIIKPDEEGILDNIAIRPELKAVEDYNSHDILSASKAVVYNGRLHMSGVKKSFFGFNPCALVPYNNGVRKDNNIFATDNFELKTYDYKFTYLIKEDGKVVKAVSDISQLNSVDGLLFYPNPNVVKVLVEKISSTETLYSEDVFKSHESLNDSVTVSNIRTYKKTYNNSDYNVGTQAYDYNKIYTSDVNSIFNFPLSGRTTIGAGTVYGVSAVSKALSPGQFGQFPLYAFSSEGVYAMEVNPNTGLFSSIHLISRDVCNNADSITQIDGAVLFTSERGVLLVDGSDVRPISAEMNGLNFNINNVVQLNTVLTKEGVLGELGGMIRFSDFIRHCQMAYDYPNSRIVLFRQDMSYAYVYSLNSRSWATISADYNHVVTDYPNVYMQGNKNQVYDLFDKIEYDSGKEAKTIIVTRPMKFGNAEYKSINTIINRGILKKGRGGIILFASLDGLTYYPIGSAVGQKLTRLQGTAHRYFRLAIVGNMSMNESLSMSSVFITPKWIKKPR